MLLLFILIAGAVFSYVGPWWAIAPVCFVGCWRLSRRPSRAFWQSAGGSALLWVGYGMYLQLGTGAGLTRQLVGIFPGARAFAAGTTGGVLTLAASAVVVALVSGFAVLAGLRPRQLFRSAP